MPPRDDSLAAAADAFNAVDRDDLDAQIEALDAVIELQEESLRELRAHRHKLAGRRVIRKTRESLIDPAKIIREAMDHAKDYETRRPKDYETRRAEYESAVGLTPRYRRGRKPSTPNPWRKPRLRRQLRVESGNTFTLPKGDS